MSDEQEGLFDANDYTEWQRVWQDMPEYEHERLRPWKSVLVHFASREALLAFSELVDQPVSLVLDGKAVTSIWYPKAERAVAKDKRYVYKDEAS